MSQNCRESLKAGMNKPFERIFSLMKQRRYGSAIESLYDRQSRRLKQPYQSDAHLGWYCVGDAFYKQGDFRKAIEAFRKALKTRAGDSDTLWAIADCYSDDGRPKLAERFYRKAKSGVRGPQAWHLTYNIANSLFDQRKYRDAVALFRKIPSSEASLFKSARKNIDLAQHKVRLQPRIKATEARAASVG